MVLNRLPVLLAVVLLWGLAACVPVEEGELSLNPTAVPPSPITALKVVEDVPTLSPTPKVTASLTASATATMSPTATARPSETPTPTGVPTLTPTASRTAKPSPTPYPTPFNLPPAPRGWQWQLQATRIPVTHYIIYELSADDLGQPGERPYGLDDEPMANIEPLPRKFLLETAYQGSGRLPDGNILQYAAVRPPVEQGLVPFRYVITPAEQCGGHPRAGNGTCSVPLKTAATTWREGDEPLVPIGSTIFIPELNMKIRINDVSLSDGPSKIDLYTGTVNNYDYERPDGATIWILVEES